MQFKQPIELKRASIIQGSSLLQIGQTIFPTKNRGSIDPTISLGHLVTEKLVQREKRQSVIHKGNPRVEPQNSLTRKSVFMSRSSSLPNLSLNCCTTAIVKEKEIVKNDFEEKLTDKEAEMILPPLIRHNRSVSQNCVSNMKQFVSSNKKETRQTTISSEILVSPPRLATRGSIMKARPLKTLNVSKSIAEAKRLIKGAQTDRGSEESFKFEASFHLHVDLLSLEDSRSRGISVASNNESSSPNKIDAAAAQFNKVRPTTDELKLSNINLSQINLATMTNNVYKAKAMIKKTSFSQLKSQILSQKKLVDTVDITNGYVPILKTRR